MGINAPATKHDLELGIGQLRSDVKQDIEQLRSEVNHGYRALVGASPLARQGYSKLFTASRSPNNKRITEIESTEAALRNRLGTVEERLLEVEKRLNIPPAA